MQVMKKTSSSGSESINFLIFTRFWNESDKLVDYDDNQYCTVKGTELQFSWGWNETLVDPIYRFQWNFGDGTTSEESKWTVYHTYNSVGNFTIDLRIWNDEGQEVHGKGSIDVREEKKT
ncbi:MAG: PKD domain-containing protein [Candidatus Hodarchaeales archaeon]